jgi:hypothetical protein
MVGSFLETVLRISESMEQAPLKEGGMAFRNSLALLPVGNHY